MNIDRERLHNLLTITAGCVVVGTIAIIAATLLGGCSPAPARNRVTPGTAGVAREVRGPIEWRLEVTQPRPQRVYVPTEAEEVER